MPASFTLNKVDSNPGGWGPSEKVLSQKIFDIPYSPFSKSDRLGRIADWSVAESYHDRRRREQNTFAGDAATSSFAFSMGDNDMEEGFSLVDRSLTQASSNQRKTTDRKAAFNKRGGYANRGQSTFRGRGGRGGRGGKFNNRYGEKTTRVRESSLAVKPEWKKLQEIEFQRLSKLFLNPSEPSILVEAGSIRYYDKSYDRLISKQEKALIANESSVYNETASNDSILKDIASKIDSNDGKIHVFTTDVVLSFIMSAPISVYSWDVIITKKGNQLWLDKRDGSAMDYYSVNESATEPPVENEKDSLNTPSQLAEEASELNANFINMVSTPEAIKFKTSIESSENNIPMGLRYKVWDLDNIKLYVRTHVDIAVHQTNSNPSKPIEASTVSSSSYPLKDTLLVTLRALNEYSARAGLDWRTKLDSQKGAIIVTELKNNGVKLTRWALEALLAGSDQLRLGFIGRLFPKDPTKHVIYGVDTFRPTDFITQINYNVGNGWGITKALLEQFKDFEAGRYVLLRDPNKPSLHIINAPDVEL